MKRMIAILLAAVLLCCSFAGSAFAEKIDLSRMSDSELTELFRSLKEEMRSRGLAAPDDLTLRDGKYIVGEDILPGSYEITCVQSDGESYGEMYSSFGSIYSGMEGGDDGLGSLMGALGGMMGTVLPVTVEILGDYGTVLKSMELKAGDSAVITLTAETALQISDGSVRLTAR